MNIRVGHLSTIYHTALILQCSGMLEKHGVRATWKLFGGGPAIVEAMKKGEVDIGYIGLPPAMIGIAEGAGIKCVAGGHVEGTVLCTQQSNSSGGVDEVVRGLESTRIGSPPKGSIHDIIIRHLLSKHDVDADVVNYSWADFIPLALENEGITAAVGTPALAVFLKRELGANINLSPDKIWPFNPSYGIIATEGFLDSKELRVFVKLHEEASMLIINSPREAAAMVAKTMGFVDADFALEVMKLSPRYCASLPEEYIDSTLDFIPIMLKLGYLSRPLKRDEIFYSKLIDDLHPRHHHYNEHLNI